MEETTLDREQLKSFVEALAEPVHLTQGPPGTGKSYLGKFKYLSLDYIQYYSVNFFVYSPS